MKYVLAIPACAVMMVVTLLSLPWIVIAIGLGVMGDEEGYRDVLERSPAYRLMDWAEPRL